MGHENRVLNTIYNESLLVQGKRTESGQLFVGWFPKSDNYRNESDHLRIFFTIPKYGNRDIDVHFIYFSMVHKNVFQYDGRE